MKALLADLAERRAAQEAAVESWTDGDAGRSLQSLLDAGGILDDEEGDLLRRQAALDARDPPAEAAMDRCTKNLAFLDLLERAPGGPDAAWWYLVAQKRVGTRSPYEARQDRLLQAWAIDPTHAAYASIPGAVPGPTAYASTSVIESFAESFMLFHLDPEALKAVTPQVHAWFAAGSHLDAARAGLRTLELVVDPASTGERQAP
ncbi:MAG: hypothetical protein KC656_15755 [Myxococcales bacterium]|nr:hypothetical protein [Myxococcales bacterium]MCB9694518.1 hypothetical protein [Alphaproteobacteria bacterium]